MAETKGKAPVIPLTDEGKLRVVYLLLMHQKLDKINYEDFNPGTGHSTRAIQGLMERLKKQYITDAKNGDAAATIASTPKKRGRPSKKAGEKTKDDEPPAKKGRKNDVKEDSEKDGSDMKDVDEQED